MLIVFSLYAPSLGHMLFYDDPLSIVENMLSKSLLGIFVPGTWEYRPVALFLWNLVRDLFGWYTPALIHLWNVATHVLNTALVMALAARLASAYRWRTRLFPLLAGLIFGLFPLSFQAVTWAGAVYHPLKALFGLIAMLVFLAAKEASETKKAWAYVLILACLAAAFLSHESGVVFGPLLIGMELLDAAQRRAKPRLARLAIGVPSVIYALLYRSLFRNHWSLLASSATGPVPIAFGDLPAQAAYFLQALDYWLAALARPLIGLQSPAALNPWILLVGIAVPVLGGAVLWARRRFTIGLLALSIWLLDAAILSVSLDANYILGSPRMTYTAAIGIALFWAATIAALAPPFKLSAVRVTARTILTAVALATCLLTSVWAYGYVTQHISEVRGLTTGMQQLDADLQRLPASTQVLLINMPAWSSPSYPAFLFGAEGDVIYLSDPSRWIGAIGGHYPETVAVQHTISFVGNTAHEYGLDGTPTDDTGLRAALLKANLVYRFEFNTPGLRLSKLAELHPATVTDSVPLALFVNGDAHIRLLHAQAAVVGQALQLDLTWASDASARSPTGVFVHVFDTTGKQILAADQDFVSGYLPPELVPAETVFEEIRRIPLTPELLQAARTARVKIGFYDRATGQRFLAQRVNGVAWDEDAALISAGP
jgi:hypothetical protein